MGEPAQPLLLLSRGLVFPLTFSGHILDIDLVLMSHVAKDGEDGKARDEAGDAVDGAGKQSIPGEEAL